MRVVFRPEAEKDFLQATEWYEMQIKGLGNHFIKSVEKIIGRISDNPNAFPRVYKNIRRALVYKFPYLIYYLVQKERIVVIALFHI